MVSDEMPEVPAAAPAESAAVTVATGVAERRRRRRIATLALLVAVLALLVYSVLYFQANRQLPLPEVVKPAQSKIEPPRYLYSITGTGKTALTKPIGVGVANGRAYVVDFGTRTIMVFTTDGSYLFSFNKITDGAEKVLRNPVHLAIDADGNVWVTDRRLRSVYVFDRDGKFLRKFIPNGDPAFEWSPFGITIDPAGSVYVTDIPGVKLHRVVVFDKSGKLISEFGQAGQVTDARSGQGEFSYPNGIAITKGTGNSRDLYVADSNNRRVQVFAPDGSFKRIIATEGTPRGIALDSDGRLYVVDVLSHRIDIYSKDGGHLASFGENGFGPGQFQYPEDVAIDGRGRIYVSDRENNQVQVWGYRALQVPGITRVAPGQIPWCVWFLPLVFVPLFFRRRRFVVTQDFVDGMITAEMVPQMINRRWRWMAPPNVAEAFVGRVVDGISLGDLIEGEPYSRSDATALADKLGIELDRAGLLSMAKRAHRLCTEDAELARLAVLLDIDVYDRAAFVRRYVERGRR